ncbi:zf-TFIIB domain-containing protein [Syntrophorhabdus aromaticivorans]|uniref:Uncharacterized protein n=1 Tax=Syntrophorhabdus aromaticivorans TaxID=328301 RepID=A0A351U014_9BACT|nr:zf-TFIIB domain-containing protein [Syntrophorhabdus aromaticivorans]NLW34771.1 hypothetical protein [Syntrophorhabdus aromaticivorans]HBA53295.1 hypothetical protein [Syntrophorhabdus aromaticivorans]
MNYEIRPWGTAFNPTCHCPKCGTPMHNDHDRQSSIEVRACFKCGNRVYPEYPKRPGTKNMVPKDVENLAA